VASLNGELIREHFGLPGFPAVRSRAWLGWFLADCGAFSEGMAYTLAGRVPDALLLLAQVMEQARTELSTAIELYRSMEMTFWLLQAEAALVRVL
jgi:hypothetical protein